MNFNVVDVYKDISERKRKRKESFKHVLRMCQKQIRNVANKDRLKCVFTVPEFIAGIPIFNVTDCTDFVKTELEKAGFAVTYYYPNLLFISWDVDDLEKSNVTPLTLEFKSDKDKIDKDMMLNDRETKHFVQQHITSKPKPKKKFVLNLQ